MTFAHWDITADAAALHEHLHPQEEVWNIIEGEIALTIDGVERILSEGGAAIVPSATLHSARPLGACRVIVTDYPLRRQLPGVSNET